MTTEEIEKFIGEFAKGSALLTENVTQLTKTVSALAEDLGKFIITTQKEFAVVHNDIEKLAIASQQEFAIMHHEFAAVHNEIGALAGDIKNADLHLSVYISRSEEDHVSLQNWIGQVDNRVKFLEKLEPSE